ncbi:tRNA dihydrouridine synthase DusB [Gimesia aquarii]|uniref:tRNA-dihydrouridine synthase n=1 Tax=Gimesia aquarii TaxID=2527964 RepID=A0A517VYM7_9PLAN|nr:tRNA dihydrouridine synthase DusB [Gimesia aquarii]QDT98090.1 putative tRNA-dihydrouridine synthase [Gimesia aquarii]
MKPSLPPQPDPRPPVCYGSLQLESRYLLSPLAGYTNLPFRRIVRELGGVGLATTDLVNARGLLEGSAKTLQLIQTCPEDTPFAVQIFGNEPIQMRDAAQLLEERGVDSIDINMGCPVNRIVKGGAGASMMCRPDETVSLVKSVVEAVKIPVTVKMRLGWDDRNLTAPFFAREFEQVGVVAVAIHGRTREQGFRGSVNHEGIRQVVEAVESIPVIGNGDVTSIADADNMLKTTGCAGVSIGRGALANPWIFRQLVQWENTGECAPPGNFNERLELLLRQFHYLLEMTTEERALPMFRKMGHWYLKSMRVKPALRHEFQCAQNLHAFNAAIKKIAAKGPVSGSRDGTLPEMHIPVPGGPVERW